DADGRRDLVYGDEDAAGRAGQGVGDRHAQLVRARAGERDGRSLGAVGAVGREGDIRRLLIDGFPGVAEVRFAAVVVAEDAQVCRRAVDRRRRRIGGDDDAWRAVGRRWRGDYADRLQ